jgi:hypothetical protein
MVSEKIVNSDKPQISNECVWVDVMFLFEFELMSTAS